MKIKGQKFYYMLDAERVAKFGIQDVAMVTMETVEIDYLDEDWNVVRKEIVFIVTALLMSGDFVATKPHTDRDSVATIANTLADMCNKQHNAHLN